MTSGSSAGRIGRSIVDNYRAWEIDRMRSGYLYAFIPAEGQPHSIYRTPQRIFGIHFKELTYGHIQKFTMRELEQLVGQQFRIVDRKFRYHFLGSVMDYLLFVLLLNERIAKAFWAENKYYHGEKREQSDRGSCVELASDIRQCDSLLRINVPAK